MPKFNELILLVLLLICMPTLQVNSQTLEETVPQSITQQSDDANILFQSDTEDSEKNSNEHQPNVKFTTDINFLKYVEFSGQYHSEINEKLFNYLESREGLLESIFYENSEWSQEPDTEFNALALELFDPVYHDRGYVILALHLQNRTGEGEWVGVNSQAEFQSIWKGRSMDEENLQNVNFTVKIKNVQSQDLDAVQVEVSVSGQNFKFHTTMKYTTEKWSIIGYCLYTTFVVAAQVLLLSRVISKIDNDAPHLANKISLTTVSMCNIMDFYSTIIHIQYIITSVSSYYLFYIFPSTAYIFLFIIYDMKLLFLVWRSHTLREINNPQDLRKNLTVFYIKFYLGLFLYLAFIYFFIFDEWFIILQNLIFIPQIVRNVRMGNNPGFQPFYVFGYLGMRYLIPLYERGCPGNHFMLMPMTGVVITIGILYGIQIAILLLQFIKGPRFFVPKIFQPDYFDYRAKIKYNEDTKQLDCSICLLNFFESTQEDNIQNSSAEYSLSKPMFEEKSVMKTPCNHYFHRDCLTNWADVKLECPTCRSPLPPL